MKRDEIIRMAQAAGFGTAVERFAELVAAAEREACANVCDAQQLEPECPERASYCAEAIRARGQKEST